MKVVILAGGLGSRMGSDTQSIPKPMVEIDGKPILWHIMKYFIHYGHKEFIICLGYRGEVIKDFFKNYAFYNADVTIAPAISGDVLYKTRDFSDWCVTLVNTGETTTTGGRIKRVEQYVGSDTFLMTYGDGLSDINISELIKSHHEAMPVLTVSAVHPPGRFGSMIINQHNQVTSFHEKQREDIWINGGFMVMDPAIFSYLDENGDYLEATVIETLAKEGEVYAHKHSGFWKPMDTPKDRLELEEMWKSGKAPWKVWNE